MASITVTIPNGTNPRATLQRFSSQLRELSTTVPDVVTGGATIITFDNAPVSGLLAVQITSGPHSSTKKATC